MKWLLWAQFKIPVRSINGLPTALLRHIEPNRGLHLVDAGAHHGAFTSALARYCPISQALLIEPQPEKANLLKKAFTPPQYMVVEGALSSSTGTADLRIYSNDATTSLLAFENSMPELGKLDTNVQRTIRCQTFTLDDLSQTTGFERADLVKIDVQGAEHAVLLGARQFLSRTSRLWIEISFRPIYHNSATFFDVYGFLQGAGFKLLEIEPGFRAPDGELLQADILFARL